MTDGAVGRQIADCHIFYAGRERNFPLSDYEAASFSCNP